MADEVIKKLLEAGVHFGHQTKRWNPKMKKFIFGERSGIYIIDLEKTAVHLNQARDFLYEIALKGGTVLYIGTKKQAQEIVAQEATRAGMFYVNNRWLGGLMTNFQTVKKSIERLKEIEKMSQNGMFERLTKKEVAGLTKEKDKLVLNLGGIRDMTKLPNAVIVVDTKKEEIAVKEANRLKISVIGLIDTNCDPDVVDYPIPGNDDAVKSIRHVITLITDSICEGRKEYLSNEALRKEMTTKEAQGTDVEPSEQEQQEDIPGELKSEEEEPTSSVEETN